MNMNVKKSMLTLTLAGLMACSIGCSPDSITIPTADGGKAVLSADSSTSSTSFKTDSGTTTISDSSQLPEGFPKDVPMPGKSKITSSLKSAGTDGSELFTVTFDSEVTLEKAKEELQTYLKSAGYQEPDEFMDEAIYITSGKKDKQKLHYTLTEDNSRKGTFNGVITYEVKQ